MRKQTFNPDEVQADMLEFYRRAPVLVAPPRQPFEVTTETREFKLPERREEIRTAQKPPPKQRVLGPDVPPAPVIHNTDHGVDNVTIHWHPVTDPATGQPCLTYMIFHNVTGFGGYVLIYTGAGGTGANRSFHEFGLPSDTDIYYLMRAVGEGGESENSPLVVVRTDPDPIPPIPPVGVSANYIMQINPPISYLYYNQQPWLLQLRACDEIITPPYPAPRYPQSVVDFNGVVRLRALDGFDLYIPPSVITFNGYQANSTTPVFVTFVHGVADILMNYRFRFGQFYAIPLEVSFNDNRSFYPEPPPYGAEYFSIRGYSN